VSENPERSVSLESNDETIATIWFDAPGRPVNTFSAAVFDDLEAVLDQIDAMAPTPKQVRFASAKERTFIAGADLKAIRDLPDRELDAVLKRGQVLFSRIAAMPMQTVAMINGAALGGGLEVALACDFRIAGADPDGKRTLGLPEITLGIIPGWGGTVRLPLLIGVEAATEMLLSGIPRDPAKAKTLGIVDDVVPSDEMKQQAQAYLTSPPKRSDVDLTCWEAELAAGQSAAGAIPAARQFAAETLTTVLHTWLAAAQVDRGIAEATTDLAAMQIGLDLERQGLVNCRNSEGGKALIAAFFDKRKK